MASVLSFSLHPEAWDTTASKCCTCLHGRRLNTFSSHIFGPNLCAPWDHVSLCGLSSPISLLLFMDFICQPCAISFFTVMHVTQISPEHSLSIFQIKKLAHLWHCPGSSVWAAILLSILKTGSSFNKCHFSCESSIETAALCISRRRWEGCFSTNAKAFWLERYL